MGFSPLVAHPDSPREWPPGPLSPDAPGHPAGPNNGLLAGAQAGLAGRACGMALTIYTRTHWPSMCNVQCHLQINAKLTRLLSLTA